MASGRDSPRSQRPSRRGAHARLLRIIGGHWRGRRLRFPDVPEIRPTPDRVRETLFNWLGERIRGARCLDLFAGSGALGLEALSRGAGTVQFVESDGASARALSRVLAEWGADPGAVHAGDALAWLRRESGKFDVAFLDPPFGSDLLPRAAMELEAGGRLAPNALIYVECAARRGLPELPGAWRLLREKRSGEVGYHLFERHPAPGEPEPCPNP